MYLIATNPNLSVPKSTTQRNSRLTVIEGKQPVLANGGEKVVLDMLRRMWKR